MRLFKTVVILLFFGAVVGKGKKKKNSKAQIAALESALTDVQSATEKLDARLVELKVEQGELNFKMATLENKSGDKESNISDQLKEMEAARVELDRAHAWQALHMAAAAACRGSTPSGGTGPWGNAVLAKENTMSCTQICGETAYNLCDADVSVIGYKGQAASYTDPVGHFYNYGCGTPGNTNVMFDEVKAGADGLFQGRTPAYYRFCCCRKS